MKIKSEDFQLQEGEKVSLKKWPTLVEPVCRSKKLSGWSAIVPSSIRTTVTIVMVAPFLFSKYFTEKKAFSVYSV
ncbi:MAG: hypothetical protein WBN96_00400, partial [Gammaproteobacteria bacterium]